MNARNSMTLAAPPSPTRCAPRMRAQLALVALIALCAGRAGAQTCLVTESTEFAASDGQAADQYGISVALDGNVAVIGANLHDDLGATAGAAFVQRFDGSSWVQEAKLLASDGSPGDSFGWSVSLSGDVAVVGAFGSGPWNVGSVYVFRHDGTNWVEEQKLVGYGTTLQQLGYSVAVSDDVIVALALGNGGTAFVYRFDGTLWVLEQYLDGGNDPYGPVVAVSGNLIVIGSDSDDDNGPQAGAAHVYRFDGLSWLPEQKLLASDGSSSDYFGLSVSVDQDLILVGAPGDSDNGAWSGSAYAFRHDGNSWVEEQKFLPADGVTGDNFGYSVSVSGNLALLGNVGDDHIVSDSGSAYAYRFDGTSWGQPHKLLASDAQPQDYLGNAVALSGDTALVSAIVDDTAALDSGSAYVFEIACGPWLDLGLGLAGTYAEPVLTGMGALLGGDPVTLVLSNALENTNAWLIVGFSEALAPFKGGTMVPSLGLPGFYLALPTGPFGSQTLSDTWAPGVPSGLSISFQYWVADAAGPLGFAASNGLRATTP